MSKEDYLNDYRFWTNQFGRPTDEVIKEMKKFKTYALRLVLNTSRALDLGMGKIDYLTDRDNRVTVTRDDCEEMIGARLLLWPVRNSGERRGEMPEILKDTLGERLV